MSRGFVVAVKKKKAKDENAPKLRCVSFLELGLFSG